MKTFKSCRVLLNSEWKNVSEDFGVHHFADMLAHTNQYIFGRGKGVEPDRQNWKKAHELYLWTFKAPKTLDEQKKLARILKKSVPASMHKELFEYDTFLRGLGRMSLSQYARLPSLSPSRPRL